MAYDWTIPTKPSINEPKPNKNMKWIVKQIYEESNGTQVMEQTVIEADLLRYENETATAVFYNAKNCVFDNVVAVFRNFDSITQLKSPE